MTYLTFEEYEKMGGKLTQAEFDRFAFRAQSEIQNATFERINALQSVPESVKRCMFELVAYLSQAAKNGNTENISGFSNDGYSVSYSDSKTPEECVYDIIYTYLSGDEYNLMYCGVD